MRKNKFLMLAVTLILTAIFTLGAFAADDIVFEFTDEASFKGWGTSYLRYNFDPGYFNAYAYEKSANLSDPMIISPALNIQAEDYRYVIIHMSYSLDAAWSRIGQIFFAPPGKTWHADYCVSSDKYPSGSSGFRDVIFDMTKCELWTGTISQLRIDPFDCHGSLCIKSITITNTLPTEEEKEPEVKPEDQEKPTKPAGVFLKPNTYADNFADVPSTEWYAKEVANAYELGLINGKSATSFDPNGNMTIAEAITIAARTRNNYFTADYDFTVAEGEEWFAPYVKYAIDNGIIKDGEYSDYNALITRGQMAKVFAAVLPASEYAAVNSVAAVPDVDRNADYAAAVLKLYNAGIVMGNDGYGTFHPENNIIRAEAAAIINRIANEDNRLTKNLLADIPAIPAEPINMTSEAKYYMDDETLRNSHTGGYGSGWSVSPILMKSSKSGVHSQTLTDATEEYGTYLERKIIPAVSDGVLDFEFGASIYGDNGAYLKFVDKDGKSVIELLIQRGEYTLLGADGTYSPIGLKQAGSRVHYDMKINLDKKTFDFGVDGAYIGTYPFASTNPIAAFRIGSTEKGWVTISPEYASLRHNHLATERFVNAPDNILPYDIKTINEGGTVAKVMMNTFASNGGTLELSSEAGAKTGMYKPFAPASGNVVLETYIFLPNDINGAKVSLKNGDTDVFSLTTKDGNFVTSDGTVVKYVTKNLWHIVRFEADTATDTAVVKINGKVVGTYAFDNAADVINGLEITYTPATDSAMYVDDISAFIKLPYPEDYVPEPVVPESDDYLVGLNVCSLWRTGTHYGWDEISAHPEIEPVLGYYDEGSPEVSDWEIKFMSEHGIDYEIFCWYADADTNKPIFRTEMNEAIVDGYFNARYSDKLKFAIMWENTSVDCHSWESWTEYFVPYFIEYFFLDDRYMVIENKPLLTVWSYDALGKAFGDDHTPKQAFDYLREECKKVGFDGCTIMLYSSDHSTKIAELAKNQGFDCIGAYHFGTEGANLEKHLGHLESLKNETTLDRIPAVSVGFDYVGWGYGEKRNGLLDPADYPTVTNYIKDEILAKRDPNSIYSKMVIISTWNEYGEGTYVMPTARHGFAYLDAVRAAFTNGPAEHEDVTPTAAQKQRINYLYDQSRQWLRPQNLIAEEEEEKKNPYEGAVEVHALDLGSIKWTSYGSATTSTFEDGVLKITTTSTDPAIFSNSSICNIPAEDANAVRIRMKVNGSLEKSTAELFFKTNDGKDFAADKVAHAAITMNQWQDLYFDFRGKETWKGNITTLRIDPAGFDFDSAEIESVTFLKLPEKTAEKGPFTVDINGAEMPLIKEPDITGGGLMVPLNPAEGIPGGYGVLSRMKAYYSWDKYTKELVIYTNDHTVELTIGTDDIVIDGTAGKTYAKTYMYDGLPVVPLDTIAEALGYFVVWHEDGNGVSIMLNSAEDYHNLTTRIPYEYEFLIEGDTEDWTLQGCTLDTYDGFLVGNSTSNDPAVTSPTLNLDAEKYPIIKVGMKYDRQNVGKRDLVVIYFKTATTALSESRCVRIELDEEDVSSNGEVVEFAFDMSKHLQWHGKIQSIRFDPFNAPGTFEIDYIRFEKDMAAEMAEMEKKIREENLDDTIYNGDANNISYICSYSDNAEITIVEREDEPGNNCFNVKSNGGKTWTYIKQNVKFKPGTTYVVEFDVRTLGTNDGNNDPEIKASYVVNAQYNGADHIVHAQSAAVSDGFVHMKVEVNIPDSCDNTKDVMTFYANPIGNLGVNFQVDNWKMYPLE